MNKHLKLRSILLLTAFLFCGSSAMASDLKIVSMNIHGLKDNWTFRVSKILDELIKLSPDVINFQEVCQNKQEDQISFITNYLRNNGYPLKTIETQFTHLAWDVDYEYIATFSKLDLEALDKGDLPNSPLQRGYIAILVKGFWVINIHLEHRRDYFEYRSEQIKFLIDKFKHDPHLIIGDFNSTPQSVEQAIFHTHQYKAFFPGKTHLGDGGQDVYAIDGVWTSSALQSKSKKANVKIILNKPVNGNYLSDHFGVLFTFRLTP